MLSFLSSLRDLFPSLPDLALDLSPGLSYFAASRQDAIEKIDHGG